MERIFYICGLKRDKASIIDKRISLALKVINDNDITNDNLLEKIIHKVNLSKSRFLHLFKDNIGISFKDFVLTKKFLKTWIYLAQGENITDACIHGGFFCRPFLASDDINYEWTKDNYKAIWEKYMCVAPYSIVCAYNDKTMGEVYNDKLLFEKTLKIAEFILKAAEKEGIILSKELPLVSVNKAKDYPMDLKTSFHRDFECKDKPNEKEIFIDALLSLGKKHNLDSACIKNCIEKFNY